MYEVDELVSDEKIAALAGARDQHPLHPLCPDPSLNPLSIILLPYRDSSRTRLF